MASETGAVVGVVARGEREQLLAQFAELVAQRGLEHVTLEDVASAAGTRSDTVRRYFETVEDCAVEAVAAANAECFTAAAEAFVATPGDCPLAARAALGAMLRFMASRPAIVHLVVVVYPRLGSRALRRRWRNMDQFAEFLTPGFAAAGEMPPAPEIVSRLIAGGIYEILSRYYHEGRLAQLPEALPAITYLTVATFFGTEEARRVSSLPGDELAGRETA
jgi:AcrR family transcriptional regulator